MLNTCLCLLQAGIRSKMAELSQFLARELPFTYPILCSKEILDIFKNNGFSLCIFSQSLGQSSRQEVWHYTAVQCTASRYTFRTNEP